MSTVISLLIGSVAKAIYFLRGSCNGLIIFENLNFSYLFPFDKYHNWRHWTVFCGVEILLLMFQAPVVVEKHTILTTCLRL